MSNTIIQIKNSGASGNVPDSLSPGELAINYFDGKLYYGNTTSSSILFDVITEPSGLNQEIQFNNSGAFGASPNLKFNTANNELIVTGNVIVAGDISPNTDNIYSLGTSSKRWKDLYVGPGSIDIDGVILEIINGQLVITSASDILLISTTGPSVSVLDSANTANFANTQANAAYNLANSAISVSGGTINGNLIITGDLTVSGNTTTINTIELNVADNEIVLNTDWPSAIPTQNAGITINRGSLANNPNVFIRWNETDDYWVLKDNVGEFIIATTANVGSGLIGLTSSYANDGLTVNSLNIGNQTVISSSGQWVGSNTGLIGAQGVQGATGVQGFQGVAGAQGVLGAQGYLPSRYRR